MVKTNMPLLVVLTTCLFAAAADAETVEFKNKCTHPIELYHSQKGSAAAKMADIAIGECFTTEVTGPAHMFRHSADPSATLVELAVDIYVWVDLSIIPPNPGWCTSYTDCKANGTKKGFNLPISITPKTNLGVGTCAVLECAADSETLCADAYQFPTNDIKTHSCPVNTGFEVTFCYANDDNDAGGKIVDQIAPLMPFGKPKHTDPTQQDGPTQQDDPAQNQDDPTQQHGIVPSTASQLLNPVGLVNATVTLSTGPSGASKTSEDDSDDDSQQTPDQQNPDQQSPDQQNPDQQTPDQQGKVQGFSDLGEVKSTYSYKGKHAGNVAGSYNRVTDLTQCTKEPVSVHTPVGPFCEPVTMAFRGPMEIENIAVFSASTANGTWSRVSSYSRKEGIVENMVFMNNLNPDFSGKGNHGPQGYASEDGKTLADKPTVFSGVLAEASDPTKVGGGPGIATGAEVNIMTSKKCDGECLGYYGDNDYLGWSGGKKAFVTEVKMPKGGVPDQPAIWMLNAQVVQSNQYGCNCRGMGPVGGCGELDIAEVIETNPSRDSVTTHFYFFDGSVLSEKGDNFAPRSYDSTTVYVTLIDDSNDGLIKIVELASFDFKLTDLGSLYQQLVDC